MSNQKLLRKMSAKTVYGNVQKVAATLIEAGRKNGDVVDLYSVIGSAHGTKSGQSDNGNWESLSGDFEATTILNVDGMPAGTVMASNNCFLPEPWSEKLCAAVKENVEAAAVNGGLINKVDFAVVVQIRLDESNAYGYEYEARSLLPVKPTNALDHLRLAVAEAEAPKQIEAEAEAEAPTPKKSKAKK